MSKRRKHQKPERPAQLRSEEPASKEDDAALWRAFTRNIEPIDPKGRVPEKELPALDAALTRVPPRPVGGPQVSGKAESKAFLQKANQRAHQQARQALAATSTKAQPNQIDGKQVRRIGNGRAGIDARIDLHGMRQHEAHQALRVFLFRSAAKGHRMVLVITGKGGGAGGFDERIDTLFVHEGGTGRGVLRRNVPLWLAEPDLSAIVVGFSAAHIKHGGEGAIYVQLRRRR